nr:MAG TPA: hypothetical protein [Caudoviricetes sp.]
MLFNLNIYKKAQIAQKHFAYERSIVACRRSLLFN